MRISLKPNRQRIAGAGRQPHAEIRRVDGERTPANHDAGDVVLAVSAGLDYRSSMCEGMCVHERHSYAFRGDFLDEGGDIFGETRATPLGIEVTHLCVEG